MRHLLLALTVLLAACGSDRSAPPAPAPEPPVVDAGGKDVVTPQPMPDALTFSPWTVYEGNAGAVSWSVASDFGLWWDGDRLSGNRNDRPRASIVDGVEVRHYNAESGYYPDDWYIPGTGTNDDYNFRLLRRDDRLRSSVVSRAVSAWQGYGLATFIDWHFGNDAWLEETLRQIAASGAPIIFNASNGWEEGCARHSQYAFMELTVESLTYEQILDLAHRYSLLGLLPLVEVQGDNPAADRVRIWCRGRGYPFLHVHRNDLKVDGRDTLDHTPKRLPPIKL